MGGGAPLLGPALASVALIERDRHGDVLLAWCYPTVSRETERHLLRVCRVGDESVTAAPAEDGNGEAARPPRFSRFASLWHYFYNQAIKQPDVDADADPTADEELDDDLDDDAAGKEPRARRPLEDVTDVCVVVSAREFLPEKYATLLPLLSSAYTAAGSPLDVLQGYLAVTVRGTLKGGAFREDAFDRKRSWLSARLDEWVVDRFGVQSIYLWSAMLMKKRVVVVSQSEETLLRVLRALPLFVFHRQSWDMLRPLVDVSDEEDVQELQAAGVYCAGTVQAHARGHEHLYDLFVDVDAASVTVAEHARADFAMGSFHKSVASALVAPEHRKADDPSAFVRMVVERTRQVVVRLQQLSGGKTLTKDVLAAQKLPASMQSFLWNVAVAERIADRFPSRNAAAAAAASADGQ